MYKKLVLACLVNFLIAALMGLLLRYSAVGSVSVNYRFLTHAHSHVAMLGWVYLILYVLIVKYFVPDKKPIYTRLFWLTEFAVVGMMFSFPFQGYAAIPISFSTLHILCSYYFVYLVWSHHKITSVTAQYLLKTALLFMVISTFGVWCLGPAVSMHGQASAFYQIAIQFFLHFQFNGWFLIAVFALLFAIFKVQESKRFKYFYLLLLVTTIATLALPVYWFVPRKVFYYINAVAVLLQIPLLALLLMLLIPKISSVFKAQSKVFKYVFVFALGNLVLKALLQTVTLFPEFSEAAFKYHNFVIGFIHLLMLGVISGFLLVAMLKNQWLHPSRLLTFGVICFILGFLLTEGILAFQGILFFNKIGLMPYYHYTLLLSSILLPIGILCFVINSLKTKTYGKKTIKTT